MYIKHASFAVAALFACNVQAATVTVDNVTATWLNATGGKNVVFDNNTAGDPSSVKWGTPHSTNGNGEKSGYDFAPKAPIVTGLDTSFVLGEFAHNNYIINSGGAITAVDLKLTFDLKVEDDSSAMKLLPGIEATFNFFHNETNNNADPCPAGGSGLCPDLVTVSNPSGTAGSFMLNGVEYSLFISGFSGGNANANGSLSFLTNEKQRNTANLNAIVKASGTPVSEVPVPAALPLMLSALGGLGFLGARRNRKA